MTFHVFRNHAAQPLAVPGFNNIPIGAELPHEKRFSHGANEWAQTPNVTARELAMLHVMEALTEKPDWYSNVFDDAIVEEWRQETQSDPLVSAAAWEWCLAELRDKAIQYRDSGVLVVLNAGCGIFKSDSAASSDIREELKQGVQPLLDVPNNEQDWSPGSDDKVLNLVHPSLFPLVYGRTKVLINGGRVNLRDPISTCGKGIRAPIHPPEEYKRSYAVRMFGSKDEKPPSPFWKRDHLNCHKFSPRFQWLPCEVEFVSTSGTNVRITSYINNLHPIHHSKLYGTIEKLVSLSIIPWNEILIKAGNHQGKARWPPRIRTWGVEWQPEKPEWAADPNRMFEIAKNINSEESNALRKKVEEYLDLPEDVPDGHRYVVHKETQSETWRDEPDEYWHVVNAKWQELYHWKHPDAGVAFDYQQWKAGDTGNAIIKRASRRDPHKAPESPDPAHEYYTVSLQDTFRTRGLQIYVKLSSIELTPEKPSYQGDRWHIEGMLNEHIVATSVYYYDVDNVTESRVAFRQETHMDSDAFIYEGHHFEPLATAFAVPGIEDLAECPHGGLPSLQELGSVITREGRLLAWPSTLQHRVEPFELIDKQRPGYRRFIVLWLTDPNYRVCSTRNVPPQQHDWWKEEAFASAGFNHRNVPPELADMVDSHLDDWPMGLSEAKRLRLKLMKERTAAQIYQQIRGGHTYNFCED